MRNSRALIVGLILIILAGLVAWKFLQPGSVPGQSISTAARSPASAGAESSARAVAPREPAHDTVSQTNSASMESAPPSGGARLDLHSIQACHDALLSKLFLESMGDCDQAPGGPADARICRDQLARVTKRANDALAAAGSCPSDLLHPSAYYEAVKELAVRGDIPAQRCFITGYFMSAVEQHEDSPMRPDQVDEYRVLAKRFIDEGLGRGDWSVVRWLAKMRTGLQDGLLMGAYPFGSNHPETAYRMNYLLMLGNQHNFEARVDPHELIQGWQPDKDLPPEKLKEAQDWAQNMFDQHFNGSQEGASLKEMCER